jgi:hypothetical protein
LRTWLIEATAGNTRTRKTARKTTAINPLSQTTINAWLIEATAGNTMTRKTARKTTAINPLSQTTIDDFYRRNDDNDDDEPKSKRLKEDKHAFTASSSAKDDLQAETINLINETLKMCREDKPGSITMIVDSGASHILLRH